MEIKGVSILEYYLTKSLHEWGFDDLKARAAADFMYDDIHHTIYFPFAVAIESNEEFQSFAHEQCGWRYIGSDPFILSFFHELGHWATWEDWTEEDWNSYHLAVKYINDYGLALEDYFSLPQEKSATQWAVRFIQNNEEEIEKWWRFVKKITNHIYKINNIETEVIE